MCSSSPVENELGGCRSVSWGAHAAALLLLALVALLRFQLDLAKPQLRTDERIYLQAFRAVAAGESPYRHASDGLDFYYPPAFALLGARALERSDEPTVLLALRVTNLAGLALCVWLSALFLPTARLGCLVAGSAYIALAPPPLAQGFASGNLSFAVVGATLVALAGWRRSPALSGLTLGLSSMVKPLAPLGLATLALHRPSGGGRRHLGTVATGLAVAGALTFSSPFLADYLALDGNLDVFPLRRSVSLYRWLHLTGLPVSPLAPLGLVALLTAWCVRRAPLDPRRLFVVAIVAMTLATPALWGHTMLLVLPLQAMACGRWWTRRRRRIDGGVRSVSPLARYELPFVVLAAAALQFVDGIGGGIETAPRALQLVVLAVPLAAPLALAAYVWSNEPTSKPPGNLCAA